MAVGSVEVSRQERVGWEAQATAARVMGQMNVLAWQLVEMLVEVIDAEAWGPGGGLRSPKHWLCWRTGLSDARAERLVQIARRVEELPACIALFRAGRLSEDAMAVIARKAPPERANEPRSSCTSTPARTAPAWPASTSVPCSPARCAAI